MFSPTPATVPEMKVGVRLMHPRQQTTPMFENRYTEKTSKTEKGFHVNQTVLTWN